MYSAWRVNFLLPAFFPLPQAYVLSMEGEFPPLAFFPLPQAYVLSMEGGMLFYML